jgi:phage baseplate assembly protein W
MRMDYYTFPLRPDKLMKGETHEKCGIRESIGLHIHLIMTTAFGEMQQDARFGCSIWDCDFDNLTAKNKIRERIKLSVQQSVQQYEPRLQQVKVEVYIKEEELNTTIYGRQVKKRMEVHLNAVNKITNEPFQYRDSFFTGPLSYY